MTGPEQHANTVLEVLSWEATTPEPESWGGVRAEARDAVAALVALAERAATLERERDEARRRSFVEPGIGTAGDRRATPDAAVLAKCVGALQGLAEGSPEWGAKLAKHEIPVAEATEALHSVLADLEQARAEADRLRETLRFYADPANWRQLETMGASSADLDRGMDARAALTGPQTKEQT